MIENTHNATRLFDYYEIRARIIPTLLVFLPLVLSSIAAAYIISDSVPWTTGSVLLALVIVYALSFVVRALGRRIEISLWAEWNGPPSTRFMRWEDDFFSRQTKKEYNDAITAQLGIRLKDEMEERENPSEADKLIMDAFRQVKSLVRIEDPKGVWNAHNAEYGFLRNILGSRFLWLVLSLLGTVVYGCLFYITGSGLTLFCLVANGLSAVLAVMCCSLHSQMINFTKQVADRYAESTWGSFITIYRKRKN